MSVLAGLEIANESAGQCVEQMDPTEVFRFWANRFQKGRSHGAGAFRGYRSCPHLRQVKLFHLSWHRIEGKATKTATVWVLISAISAPGVPWSQQFWEPLHCCCCWWWWCPHDLVNAELHHHCYYWWWISCDITIYPHYWWFTRICEWSQTLPQKIKCFIPCKSSHDILMVHSILYLPHWGLISKVVFTLLMITTYLFIDQHKHFLSKKWWVISQYEGAIWCSTSSFFMVNMPNFLTIQSVADGPLQGLPVAPNAALSAERSWRRSVLRNRDLLSWKCGYLHDMSVINGNYSSIYLYLAPIDL